jgi:hypothetical protein
VRSKATAPVIDLSDPENPLNIDRIDTPGLVTSVLVSQNRLYVGLAPFSRVRIYEVAAAQSPMLLGEFSTAGPVEAMRLDGNELHVAQYEKLRDALRCLVGVGCVAGEHVEVFDVTDPTQAVLRGAYDGRDTPAVHMQVTGGHVVVSAGDGLAIYAVEPQS